MPTPFFTKHSVHPLHVISSFATRNLRRSTPRSSTLRQHSSSRFHHFIRFCETLSTPAPFGMKALYHSNRKRRRSVTAHPGVLLRVKFISFHTPKSYFRLIENRAGSFIMIFLMVALVWSFGRSNQTHEKSLSNNAPSIFYIAMAQHIIN